jgi:peptidoglycan/xylan/chitin deacetylase (PgdA/CDA1 family)
MSDRSRRIISPFARHLNLKLLIRASGQPVIFPFYHVVSDRQLPHLKHLYRHRDIRGFEADLDDLLRLFEPASLTDYLKEATPGKKRGTMVLSFDDGLAECYHHIAPMLKRKGVPALFFLNNRFIDNREIFFRYKASILVDRALEDQSAKTRMAAFLEIPELQVADALLMVNYRQQAILEALAQQVEVDFGQYLADTPVYLTSPQVKELIHWGFEIGGHGADHADFSMLSGEEILEQVRGSLGDLKQRFGESLPGFFSFPFTSHGIPGEVISALLEGKIAAALLGTAGLKRTRRHNYIERIPMETLGMPALETLKAEYLYYLLKEPLGRNRTRA